VSDQTKSLDEEIEILDRKLGQLKREFEQYFLGTRPREPVLLKAEVYKKVAFLSQQPIQNTALRFRFGTICSRYQSMRRQWEEILRKIEAGTYERHQFKAKLHERERNVEPENEKPLAAATPAPPARDDVFEAYLSARRECGQSVKGLTREKLDAVLEKQRADLRKRFGDDTKFRFRVVVEDGQARVKASRQG
jgi:hypothetical protein